MTRKANYLVCRHLSFLPHILSNAKELVNKMTRVEAPAGEPGDLGLELEAGTIVKCVTCHDTEIRGEVLALDLNKKAILIGIHISIYFLIKTEQYSLMSMFNVFVFVLYKLDILGKISRILRLDVYQ